MADYPADHLNSQLVKTRWEGPFIYEPPNGDLKKDWLVWLKYQHPVTGEMVRFRYNTGFNELKTKELRRQHGKAFKIVLEELLQEGWTPFEEYTVFKKYSDKSIGNCIDIYLDNIKPDVRPNTYDKYKIELGLFKEYLIAQNLAQVNIANIKRNVITNFLQHYRGIRGWSGKTYNNYLNDITTFFNYFHNNYDDYIQVVPSTTLKRLPVDRPGNIAYNDWQFSKLKELMLKSKHDKILYQFCSVIYYGCLRNDSEGLKIKIWDFNFKTNTLKVECGTAKNRKTEYIPIYDDFKEFLLELGIDKLPGHYYLFGRGGVIGGELPVGLYFFSRRFAKYKVALKLTDKHGIYAFKHTRNVHLGEDGEDLYKIMKLNRHGDLATTMIYLRDLGINVKDDEYTKGRKF